MSTDPATAHGRRGRGHAFLLARVTLVVATCYMVLAQVGFRSVPGPVAVLIAGGLVSAGGAFRLPDRWLSATGFTAALLVVDTVWITGLLYLAGGFEPEFFYLYFFLLFLAAVGESLSLIALGAAVVSVSYLVALSASGSEQLWDTGTLIRIPFLLAVATFYGYLVDRVRREQRRAREEAAANRRLETARERLEGANARLEGEIEERRHTERALEDANRELAQLSELKSKFVSLVSHELRTPLTSMNNALCLVRSGRAGQLAGDQERFLDMALRNIERLRLMIDDLLDLSKIEAGGIEYRFCPVDVEELVEEVRALFAPQAERSRIQLSATLEEDLPPVLGDQHRLVQVLSNLLGNALKFAGEGGSVTLEAGRRTSAAGEEVAIEVVDTGPGIAPEERERIFQPFHQVGDPFTRSVRGTGLGLTIARELTWAHAGDISVGGEPGRGSRFRVSLPAEPERARELLALEEALRRHRKQPYSALLVLRWPESLRMVGRAGGWCDSLLLATADTLREALPKKTDEVLVQPAHARIVILLPGTPRQGAETVRHRLLEVLARRPVRIEDGEVPRPAIVGPVLHPEDGATARALVDRAVRGAGDEEDHRQVA